MELFTNSMNAPPMVEVTDQTDTLQIALEELKQKKVFFDYFSGVMFRSLLLFVVSFLAESMKIGSWMSSILIKCYFMSFLFVLLH